MNSPLWNVEGFTYQTIFDAGDFKIQLPISPKEKIKKMQEDKERLRQWGREIIEKYLNGEIEDLSEYIRI